MFLSFHLFFFYFIPFFTLLMFFFPCKWLSSTTKTHKNPPPSPQKLPIIGNLHQLGSSPHRSLQAMAQKHGPLTLIHLGSTPVLVVSTAQAAQEILKTHDLVFCNRPKLSIPHKIFYGSKDIGYSPYGEYWRHVRSITVLQLLSNRRVQSFQRVREEETTIMIEKLSESCGSLVDMTARFVSLTNNVLCRAAFGRTYSDRKFKDLLGRLLDLLGVFSVETYIPWLSMVDQLRGLESRTSKVVKEIDEFLEGVIKEHMEKKGGVNSGGGFDENQDYVDILLDVQSENSTNLSIHLDSIKAVILDVFVAGTDTTSTNIEWAVSELVRHPRIMKKLQQEASTIAQGKPMITEEDLEKMHYLKAFIKETMRFHIPLPLLIHRESTKDVKVMGYDIAAGTQVIINAWAIGRDPSVWEEPEEFRPERFLNSSIDYKGLHFELLPFGAGRRGCPAIPFAISVIELVLANLVYKYDLILPNKGGEEDLDMSETFGLTLHRKSPLLAVVTPRF